MVQAPTSVVAMVDSGIGGKVAVDHREGKNLIGAFYQPRLVVVDVSTLKELVKRWKLKPEEICAVGDDLMELPLLRRAGLAVTVPSAVEELRLVAHYVTKRQAGHGAIREVIEAILKAKGLWDQVLERYRV